jgi:uncharacterized RDD family membrane protein YckC
MNEGGQGGGAGASGQTPSVRREGSPYPKAALLPRAVARAADLTLSFALSSIPGKAGVLAGLLYLLVADALWHGQSVGKRIAGIKVVYLPTRGPVDLAHSMIRNSPFALVFVFQAVPLLGWVLLVLVGLPLIGFEGYMVYTDRLGIRLGDIFADTQVVDTKVLIDSPVPATPLHHHEAT